MKEFPERFHEDRIAPQPEFLVEVLGNRKACVGKNFRDRGTAEHGGNPVSAFPRFLFLVRGVDEDERGVLPGPGGPCRVVGFPEKGQQSFVGNDFRVKIDLDRLRMVAQVIVGRIRMGAPGVADTCPVNPFQAPEPGVRTPESAQGKGCGLKEPVTFSFDCHSLPLPCGRNLSSLRDGPGSADPGRPGPGALHGGGPP